MPLRAVHRGKNLRITVHEGVGRMLVKREPDTMVSRWMAPTFIEETHKLSEIIQPSGSVIITSRCSSWRV